MKRLGWALLEVIGIPSTIWGILFLIGVRLPPETSQWIMDLLEDYGAAILVVIIMVVAAETAYKTIKDDRERHEKDFYAANRSARVERAYRIFYQLHQKGLRDQEGDDVIRMNWDREARSKLRQHCDAGALSIYLSRTGRGGIGTDDRPLSEEEFNAALEFIEEQLDDDFRNFMRE